MTDQLPKTDYTALLAQCMAEYRERCERRAECRPANKTALFDALAAAGITRVLVNFDGCGDSGQIEDMSALAGDAVVTLPESCIEFLEPIGVGEPPNRRTMSVKEAIEALVYDALQETHSGWENNDGAYGDFTFDVEKRTIELDYNERYTESVNSYHEF